MRRISSVVRSLAVADPCHVDPPNNAPAGGSTSVAGHSDNRSVSWFRGSFQPPWSRWAERQRHASELSTQMSGLKSWADDNQVGGLLDGEMQSDLQAIWDGIRDLKPPEGRIVRWARRDGGSEAAALRERIESLRVRLEERVPVSNAPSGEPSSRPPAGPVRDFFEAWGLLSLEEPGAKSTLERVAQAGDDFLETAAGVASTVGGFLAGMFGHASQQPVPAAGQSETSAAEQVVSAAAVQEPAPDVAGSAAVSAVPSGAALVVGVSGRPLTEAFRKNVYQAVQTTVRNRLTPDQQRQVFDAKPPLLAFGRNGDQITLTFREGYAQAADLSVAFTGTATLMLSSDESGGTRLKVFAPLQPVSLLGKAALEFAKQAAVTTGVADRAISGVLQEASRLQDAETA